MKQNLQLKLSQHLALTPQLQQSIKLLQLSTLELTHEIEQIISENPLLEWEENISSEASETHEENPSITDFAESSETDSDYADSWDPQFTNSSSWNEEDRNDDYFSAEEKLSLIDYLGNQLRLLSLSHRDRLIISQIIANINDQGYLDISIEDILSQFPTDLFIELDEIKVCLKLVQTLDPPGIGATSLNECLILQLQHLHATHPLYHLAVDICNHYLPILANHEYGKLKKLLGVNDSELKEVIHLITQLNPKPGEAFFQQETRYVVPDVIVKKRAKKWVAQINPHVIPRLKINSLYANVLQKSKTGESLSNQLQEARWLIKNIQQRFDTILKVTQAIIDEQQQFFEQGEIGMRPLVLKEIADLVGLHESTISRVTSQKYMLSPRGIHELKYFFSSHVSTNQGGAASSTSIRALIKQLIAEEDRKKPLSDNQISDILNKKGIVVARRTVAKYRESLQINPASQRKIT